MKWLLWVRLALAIMKLLKGKDKGKGLTSEDVHNVCYTMVISNTDEKTAVKNILADIEGLVKDETLPV